MAGGPMRGVGYLDDTPGEIGAALFGFLIVGLLALLVWWGSHSDSSTHEPENGQEYEYR